MLVLLLNPLWTEFLLSSEGLLDAPNHQKPTFMSISKTLLLVGYPHSYEY